MQRPSYKVFNYTLKAGEQVPIHHVANSLNCLSATARFQIAFDDAPLTTFEKGLGYTSPVPFSKVRLLNDGTKTIKVELGFASGGVTDNRLNLPSALDANITNETLSVDGGVDANIINETLSVDGAVDANITNETLSVAGTVDANITNETLDTNITNETLAINGAVDANITGGRLEVTNEVKVKLKFAANIVEKTVVAAVTSRTKVVDFLAGRKDLFVTNLGAETVFLGGAAAGNNKGLPLGAGKTAHLQAKAETYVWNPTAAAINLAVMEMFG